MAVHVGAAEDRAPVGSAGQRRVGLAVGCTYGLRPAGEIAAAEPDVLLHEFTELGVHFATRD